MIEDGRQNSEIHQRAQSLAALIHTVTLTSAHLPDQTGLSLRKTSRLLYKNLADLSERPGSGQELSHLQHDAVALTSRVLKELLSSETSSNIPEKEYAHLVSSYTSLLNSLQSPISSFAAQSVPPNQSPKTGCADSTPGIISQGLRSKVVLITRPFSQSQRSIALVEKHGGLPVAIPMIEISDPDDWYPVDHAIVNLKGYDGVIFTSQNGVERFLGRISSINAAALKVLATRRVYAVGERTRASLEKGQIPVTLMPERFSAKELVTALVKEPLAGKRFLFPKGSIAKKEVPEALRASHAVVDEIEVYKTIGAAGASFAALDLAFRNGEIDALVFFSPSAVQNFALAVEPEHTGESVVACVGPSTAEAAQSAGFARIITAPEATAESLTEALVRYFER